MIDKLASLISQGSVILFVGAGVSRNCGLPTFDELVAHLGKELGFNPKLFHAHGDYLTLCEYYKLEKGNLDGLKSWIETGLPESSVVSDSKIHQLIVELDFPLIYTTNYDSLIEDVFEHRGKPFTKISNVSDLADIRSGKCQVIKFHGDLEDNEQLVLTESSYFSRLDFESPLDVKLRADLLRRSVLFIGYSLTDINVRYMLYKLDRQWKKSCREESTRPESFVFLSRPNAVQQRLLEERGINAIVADSDNPGEALESFLQHLLDAKNGILDD